MSNITRRTPSEPAKARTKEELQKRDAALAEIEKNEKLKAIYAEELDALVRQTEDILLFYWDRGRRALAVKRDAAYGEGAIDLLADALMVDRSTMYKTATLTAMYPEREQLMAKITEAQARGTRLTWSHYSSIVHVPEAKTGDDVHAHRRKMVDMVIEYSLTVRATYDEIKARYADDPHGVDADAPVAPKSLGGVLKRIGSVAEKAMTRFSESFDDVTARLESVSGDKVRDADLEVMEKDAEALTALAQKANEAARMLKQGATRLRREKTRGDAPAALPAGSRRPGGDPRARRAATAGRR